MQLTAGAASLEVDPADGGRWTSLRVDGLELLAGTTLPGTLPRYLSGCFPLAPYAGRTRGGVLDWRGQRHQLPLTSPPHAMHGTAVDVPWQVVDEDATSARLEVPLRAPWPFAGTVRQELRLLPDRLHARLVVAAEQEMPVVLGLHPWFARRLARGDEAELLVSGGRQYARAEDGAPTGELVAPLPPPWDDCFVGLDAPPRLRWPGALELEVTSSSDHWVLFTERPDVLCAEPQTGPPDAVRLGRASVVPAGGELALDVTLAWRPA